MSSVENGMLQEKSNCNINRRKKNAKIWCGKTNKTSRVHHATFIVAPYLIIAFLFLPSVDMEPKYYSKYCWGT